MTRQEFLRQRAIADHVKTRGVTKVRAGEAKGSHYLTEMKNTLRSCTHDKMCTKRQDSDRTLLMGAKVRKLVP